MSSLIGAIARISSKTSDVSYPVLETVGSCFNEALSARIISGAPDGMLHRKHCFVLYIGTSVPKLERHAE